MKKAIVAIFRKSIRQYIPGAVLVILLIILAQVSTLIEPVILQHVIDQVLPAGYS